VLCKLVNNYQCFTGFYHQDEGLLGPLEPRGEGPVNLWNDRNCLSVNTT